MRQTRIWKKSDQDLLYFVQGPQLVALSAIINQLITYSHTSTMRNPSIEEGTAVVFAGIPKVNKALYHQVRFSVGDPAALIRLSNESVFIVRDIEVDRARQHARADRVACPADFAPAGGLSGDRETATAQALAEFLAQANVLRVIADRTLPLIFADEIRSREIPVSCDRDLGVLDRRVKDDEEVAALREAQTVTERAVRLACERIANAKAAADGQLMWEGAELTSERVRAEINSYLINEGYDSSNWIVAGGADGSDCHEYGTGVLRTEQPVIVDIFPRDAKSGYHGDCTRTVVHGSISKSLELALAAVCDAKQAATAACRAGVTGEFVHAATTEQIQSHGFAMGFLPEDAADDCFTMPHGTGHGIGLDVHEPPLLDVGGPELFAGDAVTIEPGLYSPLGGIRVEDMVIVRDGECENLNALHEGLDWT